MKHWKRLLAAILAAALLNGSVMPALAVEEDVLPQEEPVAVEVVTVEEEEDPAEPAAPVDPEEPDGPTDPVDPAEPTDPVEPADPVDPEEPAEPTDPVDPTDPEEPEEPEEPVEKQLWELPDLKESYTAGYGSSFRLVDEDCEVPLTFLSENSAIAKVDETGKVTIKGLGATTVTITAAEDEEHLETVFTVSVTGTKGKQVISVANTIIYKKPKAAAFSLGATVKDKAKVTYATSNKKVATVSSKGKVTPKAYGTATITITAAETKLYKKATLKVTVHVYRTVKKLSYSSSYKKSKYYKALTKLKLTGGTGTRIVSIALSQLGYHEGKSSKQLDGVRTGSGNYTEFGRYYGYNPDPWCAMFVSWCAREAGVSTKVIPKYCACASYYSYYNKSGQKFYSWSKLRKKSYTPKMGDIILFAYSKGGVSHHIGFVESVVYADKKIIINTVEGNSGDEVRRKVYTLNESDTSGKAGGMYILGVAHPKY